MNEKKTFRNKDINNNPILIICIGVLVLGIVAALLILNRNQEMNYQKAVLAIEIICGVLGVYFICYGIFRMIILAKLKKLRNDINAYQTEATFIKASYSSINGSDTRIMNAPVKAKATVYTKLVYEYTDEAGVKRKAKSVISYSLNQSKYLEALGKFPIKCKGKLTLITLDVPEVDETFDFNLLKGEVKTPGGTTKF